MITLVYAPATSVPISPTIFPDNTSQVWKLDPKVFDTNFAQITWTFSHEGEFMQVAQLKNLLDSHGIEVRLLLTYLPYGRQDKVVSNEATFALRTFASLINSLDFSEVVIHDPHSEIAMELIDGSSAYYPASRIHQVMKECEIDLVCYPDKGALTKYSKIYDYQYIYGEKVREQSTGNILSYQVIGDCAGKNVLIIDDICDGGMTFKILAKDLLASGAKSVVLFVSHGIFSKGVRTLLDAGISRVFTSNEEVFARYQTNFV